MARGLTFFLILLIAAIACSDDQPTLITPDEARDAPPPLGLSIGPINGLTTVWHSAPARIAVPIGTDVQLAFGAGAGTAITWSGAIATRRDERNAYALCRMQAAGEHVVRAEVGEGEQGGDGGGVAQVCVITAVDVDAADIVVQARASVSPVTLGEDATNAETMYYYFAGGNRFQALSALRQVGPDHYRTAVNRVVRIDATVEPAIFSSLIEWRTAGASPALAQMREYIVSTSEPLTVAIGPPVNARRVRVDTYQVEIVSRSPDGPVFPGEPVTLRARTIPAGFENDITWLSSTKYGSACPVLGRGPVFTVVFEDTWGPHPDFPDLRYQWLGARADNATFNYDVKARAGGLCELAILEFVGRPFTLPPNGELHFPHIPCSLYPPPFPALPAGLAPAQSTITDATVCYYDITAANLNAACDSIFKAHGPVDAADGKRHAGSTEMKFTANWKETSSEGGTSTIHVESVTYTIKVWLPRWTNVPAGDQAAWNNLINELEKHEQGHVDRYKNTMTTVNTQVSCTNFNVASATTDSIIGVMANQKVHQNAAFQAGEQDQAKYDQPQSPSNPTGTNHGTQNGQNASWPAGQLLAVQVITNAVDSKVTRERAVGEPRAGGESP